ncbi:hypothetical protein [Burkholderia stagnalis]
MNFSTITNVLASLATVMYTTWGVLIFIIVLGVLTLMASKGWAQMKTVVIAGVCCVVFFCIPGGVSYMKNQAASSINSVIGSGN